MASTTNLTPGEAWTKVNPFSGSTAADRTRNFRLAKRHTRLVRTLRWLFPASTVGILMLYLLLVMDTSGVVSQLPRLEVPRIIPENLTMDNPSYEGYTDDGGRYTVHAKTAVQDFTNTDFVRLNTITGDLYDAKKARTRLTAVEGEFNTKENQLVLSGGIDIVADSGLKAKLSRATILTNESLITSNEPVLVEMPTGTIRSNSMRLLSKTREIAFIDDVRAHLIPPKNQNADGATDEAARPDGAGGGAPLIGGGDAPIDINANRLDIDDTGKTATFTGNVHARQADAELQTAALEVYYEGGDAEDGSTAATPGAGAKIQRIVSRTPVVMTRAPNDRVTGANLEYDAIRQVAVIDGDVEMQSGPDRNATARRVTVDQKADTILLTGNVAVSQGRNQLKGERLFVDRAKGRTQLSAAAARGDKSRIWTQFYRTEAGNVPQKSQGGAAAAAAAGAIGVFQTDPSAPITVEAVRLDVDDRAKQAVYNGEVHAVQGNFVVRTSQLKAFYTGAAGLAEDAAKSPDAGPAQLSRIEARGKVVVTSRDGQKASGDWANYDVKKNEVVLGGDVVLTQDKNVINGTKLTINMLTGQSIIDSGDSGAWSARATPNAKNASGYTVRSGRPSAIFYPKEKNAEKKPSANANNGSYADPGWAPVGPSP